MVNGSTLVYVALVCAIAAIGRTARESIRNGRIDGAESEPAVHDTVVSDPVSYGGGAVATKRAGVGNDSDNRTSIERVGGGEIHGTLVNRTDVDASNESSTTDSTSPVDKRVAVNDRPGYGIVRSLSKTRSGDPVSTRETKRSLERRAGEAFLKRLFFDGASERGRADGVLFGRLFRHRPNDGGVNKRESTDRTDVVHARTTDARSANVGGDFDGRNDFDENVSKVRVVFVDVDANATEESDSDVGDARTTELECAGCEVERNETVDEDPTTTGTTTTTTDWDVTDSISDPTENDNEAFVSAGSRQLPLAHPNGLFADSAEQLIMSQGYMAESHQVETEDGYLLRIHRVPYGRKALKIKNKRGRRPVVLVHHGLLSSSDIFMLRTPDKDIGYLLAERGYDVWFANSRGNTHSRKHVSMSASNSSFWAFGLHEIGYYDLAAVVDYVLNATGNRDLIFVGHSMGATVSYILCATRPEYNDKFRLIVSLAPVVYLKPRTLFLSLLNNAISYFKDVVQQRGMFELLPQTPFSARLGRALCQDGAMTQSLCLTVIFIMAGVDYEQMNTTLLPKVLAHYPAGTSWQVVMHFHQFIQTGEFAQWDYGETENTKRYNRSTPPPYDLDRVTAPVSIHYGENDFLAPPEDIAKLAPKIPNLVGVFKVPHTKFNHLDFLWAKDDRRLLYDFVMSLIDKYR